MRVEIALDLVTIGGAWWIADVHGPRIPNPVGFLGSEASKSARRF